MATLNLSVDTTKQTIKCIVDEKNIPDIREVRVYKCELFNDADEIEYRCDIISGTRDEENKIGRTIITSLGKEDVVEIDELTNGLSQMLFKK